MHIEILVLQKICINFQNYACQNFRVNNTKIQQFSPLAILQKPSAELRF